MNKAVSDKKVVKTLIDICLTEGLREVVISPGSRNAPLTITFNACPDIQCFSIVDERSAAFFALGMAQQTGRPVALVCTSGSALLNYAPAIAEAYYQNIPLLVISADRPMEWIDQGDGQTIRQTGALDNIVKYSCVLPTSKNANTWYVNRLVSEAFFHCRHNMAGPVHINVPLDEPLYGKTVHPEEHKPPVKQLRATGCIADQDMDELCEAWHKHDKVLLIVGQQTPNDALQTIVEKLADLEQIVVLVENTSNLVGGKIIAGVDKVVSTITEDEAHFFKPSLLITTDGAVVSKMIKSFLRSYKAKEHWHISPVHHHFDTYQQLSISIQSTPLDFFKQLLPRVSPVKSRYANTWHKRNERSVQHHDEYLSKTTWNDLKAHAVLAKQLPENWQLQWGNSSTIRYAQLFTAFYNRNSFCNRGTSGIDGSLSTSVGACHISQQPTLLIVGDLSFLYDSNGLWNKYMSNKLRIVVINNGGGGIFRFIPGPSNTDELETYFEAAHQLNMKPLAEMYGLKYLHADSEASMDDCLQQLFADSEQPILLEVKTPAKENAGVLKSYFKCLKEEL
ncbi:MULTISPECIES: 2-succinyl-5-enolpyruvyl-6-hydroxy-3-cyclohexene-1-carboxylic-acid synthase [unclassified Carboxylicivirga]|uniref:2-succinyl-5-enolpyruvyl-6-hydroxy-3- cyclohexene-1-carboxylic-acid synthase n=1 Tax=Carboxylicivirga TaxID=1628153 RepID=UPI003D328EB8